MNEILGDTNLVDRVTNPATQMSDYQMFMRFVYEGEELGGEHVAEESDAENAQGSAIEKDIEQLHIHLKGTQAETHDHAWHLQDWLLSLGITGQKCCSSLKSRIVVVVAATEMITPHAFCSGGQMTASGAISLNRDVLERA